jgi:L1 cell adhesion molecule like protein
MIDDSAATLMAYGLDDPSLPPAKAVVVDIGWSKTEVSIFDISGGMFFPVSSSNTAEACGKVIVGLMAEHCAKDFQRKSKVSCMDSSRSLMRLKKECEDAMKSLSTGQEATIDIDSLYEGIDYSSKLTRARFEDLASTPFLQLRATINDAIAKAGIEAASVTTVCLSGGLCAIPRIQSTVKGLFPHANFAKGRFETAEAQCIGAVLHGKALLQLVSRPTTT